MRQKIFKNKNAENKTRIGNLGKSHARIIELEKNRTASNISLKFFIATLVFSQSVGLAKEMKQCFLSPSKSYTLKTEFLKF